ncbi:MAG TPA: hypothetical protein VF258_01995 [Luteolibacter sp.]
MSLVVMTSMADAKAPNGVYKYNSGSGTVEIGGSPYALSKATLKKIGSVQNSTVTIKNKTLILNGEATRNIIPEIFEKDLFTPLNFTTTLKGPTSIAFEKSGTSFIATSSTPVVVKLTADISGSEVAGALRSRYTAKISNGKLTIKVKFTGTIGLVGSIDQMKIAGGATIIYKL